MGLGFSDHAGLATDGLAAPADVVSVEELQRHFARELHDQVAHPLIGLVLEIHQLRASPDTPNLVSDELALLEESARQVLRQAREMMIDLRELGQLRINLAQALKSEVPVPAGRNLSFNITSRWPRQTNGWAAFNVLRIIQQAVANAWRHGRAQKIEVLLDVGPVDEAIVVVMDDGAGFLDAPYGFGMDGMRERAAILGGTLSARTRETGGTRVEVRLPVHRLA